MSSCMVHSEVKTTDMVVPDIKNSDDERDVFAKSLPNGSGRENQDSYINWRSGNRRVFGVCDGHGKFGKIIADLASKFFILAITEREASIFVNTSSKLQDLFLEADEYVFTNLVNYIQDSDKYHDIKIETSDDWDGKYIMIKETQYSPWKHLSGGSSGTIVFIDGVNVTVANIGDSDCYKISSEGDVETLMGDHSPTSISEFTRVMSMEGKKAMPLLKYDLVRTSSMMCRPDIFAFDECKSAAETSDSHELASGIDLSKYYAVSPNDLHSAGKKLYHKNVSGNWASLISTPDALSALAYTRAFGDYYLKVHGVIAVPDISETKLCDGDSIVVGSDGVWDNWKIKDFAEIFKDSDISSCELFQSLLNRTDVLRKSYFGRGCDDTTLMIYR